MSNEQREERYRKVGEFRDWANFVVTVVISLVVGWFALKFDNQRLQIESEVSKNYVGKQWFESEDGALKAVDQILAGKVDHLKDVVSEHTTEIEVLKNKGRP